MCLSIIFRDHNPLVPLGSSPVAKYKVFLIYACSLLRPFSSPSQDLGTMRATALKCYEIDFVNTHLEERCNHEQKHQIE